MVRPERRAFLGPVKVLSGYPCGLKSDALTYSLPEEPELELAERARAQVREYLDRITIPVLGKISP
jgi:hypothetical protein